MRASAFPRLKTEKKKKKRSENKGFRWKIEERRPRRRSMVVCEQVRAGRVRDANRQLESKQTPASLTGKATTTQKGEK